MHMEARFACFAAALGLVASFLWLMKPSEPSAVSSIDQDVIVLFADAQGKVHYTQEVPVARAWDFINANTLSEVQILFTDSPGYLEASLIPGAERISVPAKFDRQPTGLPKPEPPLTFDQRVAHIFPAR